MAKSKIPYLILFTMIASSAFAQTWEQQENYDNDRIHQEQMMQADEQAAAVQQQEMQQEMTRQQMQMDEQRQQMEQQQQQMDFERNNSPYALR